MTKCLAVLVCLTLASMASPVRAQEAPVDLFSAGTAAAAPVPFGAEGIVRSRAVRLAPGTLVRRELRLGTRLRIAFFPDLVETFRRTGEKPRTAGGFVWTGASPTGSSSVTLVVGGEGVTGHAQIGARAFRVDQIDGSLHRVGELDRRAVDRPDIVVEHPSSANETGAGERALARRATSVIDVLVAYTPTAEKQSSNILADIDLGVSLANQAYAASGVEIELRAVGTMLVNYDEGGSFQKDLERLKEGEPPFKKVHKARETYRADLVSLIRKWGAFCGIADLVKHPSSSTSDRAFSVVSLDCIAGNHSFAHELGHNMGLQHDRYTLEEDGTTYPDTEIGFGFVNKSAAIRDVMGNNDLCAEDGIYCTRVNMFSTPRETWQGDQIGIRKGQPGAADGARMLNKTRSAIEGYR